MSFLTKEESNLILLINAKKELTAKQKAKATESIKQIARMRSDGFKKRVKVFLHVMSTIKIKSLAAEIL